MIQSKLLKNFIQNLSRSLSVLIFPEISQFFPGVSFIFFSQKYPEILANYCGKILRKLEKNYKIAKKKISEELKKFSENFSFNLRKVFRKCGILKLII